MEELAPATVAYVPPGHVVHVLALAVLEYAPAEQMLHTFAFVAASTCEYVPAGQFMHSPAPVAALCVSAGHGVRVRPAGPVYPASHAQSNTDPAMPSVCEFGGHIPIVQFEHAFRVSWLLYVPGVHTLHRNSPSVCA
jgi:hypothetical protein